MKKIAFLVYRMLFILSNIAHSVDTCLLEQISGLYKAKISNIYNVKISDRFCIGDIGSSV